MIKNEINKCDIYIALIKWTMNLDGNGYAIGYVMDQIPWDDEIEKVISLDSFYDEMDKVIGSRIEVNIDEYILQNPTEIKRVRDWASKRTDEIYTWYDNIIKKVNEKISNKYTLIIKKCIGVSSNGYCQYKVIDTISTPTISEVINTFMINYSYGNWNPWKLTDEINKAYYYPNSICVSYKNKPTSDWLHLEWERKND